MSAGLDESSTLALGEINKYDFRTDSPAIFGVPNHTSPHPANNQNHKVNSSAQVRTKVHGLSFVRKF